MNLPRTLGNPNVAAMANFKTHISTSTALGVAYGVAGYFMFEISLSHCLTAGALCSVAGMLPDLDSNSSIPQREMLSFVSVIVPMLMIRRFDKMGITPEYMVFIACLLYTSPSPRDKRQSRMPSSA